MRKLVLLLLGVIAVLGSAYAQNRTITGKVFDEKGSPIPNASVVIKGSTTGTTTNEEGLFSLSVPSSTAQLEVTSIGFKVQTVNLTRSANNYNVALVPENESLEDVVITGYTSVQKKKFSGASVNVGVEDLKRQPLGSFDQALQGKAAGVSAVANSGQPGANAVVRIRGNGSINGGNVPLYIMDGIEINAADFASLNQGDFERVEILKDATATAVYGSRGGNGVIVITTRKGRSGQLMLNYDAQVGFSNLPKDRIEVMNSDQKITYELQRGNPNQWTNAQADSLRLVDADWKGTLFTTGVTHQHMLSASGGNQNSRVFASLSYMDQEGIVRTTGLRRYTARVNVDNNIKNWRFGVNLMGGFSRITNTRENDVYIGSPLNAMRWSNPYDRPRDPVTGEYQALGGDGTLLSGQPNGAMELFLNQRSSLQFKGVGTAYLEYHFPFLKGLSARTNWGGDFTGNETSVYYDRETYTGTQANGTQGSLARNMNRNFRYTGTTSINYRTTFGDHELEAGLYNEVVKTNYRNFGFTGYGLTNGFTNEFGITPGNATNGFIPAVTGGGTRNGIQSFFATVNYGFMDKYFLTLVARRDGSSRFGLNNRYANFGSVGFSWAVIQEDFMSNVNFLSDLRLRASYGTNGNNNTAEGDFGQFPLFGRTSYAGQNGLSVATPGNLEYRWETNATTNVGIDFGFLNNRISGSVDVYNRLTKNLFYDLPVSLTTGFSTIPGNEGELRNRGVEVMLKGDVVKTKDFRFTIEGNITYNESRIMDLPEDSVISGTQILAIGRPLNSFFLVQYAGVNAANGNALYYTADGKLTQTYRTADKVILGTSNAPWFGAVSTTVAYKGFDLSAQLNFFLDRQVYNNEILNLTNPSYLADNLVVDLLREWKNPGDVTDVPRASSAGGNAFQSSTTRFLEDGGFFRLRNVTLGYNLPNDVLDKIKFRSARIFVQGQNWWTATKFRSFDPEGSLAVPQGSYYPALVQTTVGLSIGF